MMGHEVVRKDMKKREEKQRNKRHEEIRADKMKSQETERHEYEEIWPPPKHVFPIHFNSLVWIVCCTY